MTVKNELAPATLHSAMAKAFGAIEGAKKDADNPAFKRDGKNLKYADLESVVDAIKPALVANNLFFAQINHEQQGGVCIETIVCHEGGESMSFGKLFVPAGKNDAQGYGSALTYARRYSLMAAFGVCPEDDDGNAAVAAPREQPQVEKIDDDQWTKITSLLEATSSDVKKFCAVYKCKSVREMSPEAYARAVVVLEKKLEGMTPKTTDDMDEDSIPY